jgi:hypothetical protein
MNPRVRYSQKYDKLVNIIDGAEFPFIPNNDASRKADRAWRAAKQAKIDAETATVDAQIQALRQRRREIETKHFDPPAPPPTPMPEPIATPVVRMTQEDLDAMFQPTREAMAIRAEQAKYPAR